MNVNNSDKNSTFRKLNKESFDYWLWLIKNVILDISTEDKFSLIETKLLHWIQTIVRKYNDNFENENCLLKSLNYFKTIFINHWADLSKEVKWVGGNQAKQELKVIFWWTSPTVELRKIQKLNRWWIITSEDIDGDINHLSDFELNQVLQSSQDILNIKWENNLNIKSQMIEKASKYAIHYDKWEEMPQAQKLWNCIDRKNDGSQNFAKMIKTQVPLCILISNLAVICTPFRLNIEHGRIDLLMNEDSRKEDTFNLKKQEEKENNGVKELLFSFDLIKVMTINEWEKINEWENVEWYKAMYIKTNEWSQKFHAMSLLCEFQEKQELIMLSMIYENKSEELNYIFDSVKSNLNVRFK